MNLSAQRAFHRYPARLPFAGASASQTNSGGDYFQRHRSGGSDGEEVVAMSFISDNVGNFVSVFCLVLYVLESYFLRRPEAVLLFRRRVAAAAVAAVPILVLFFLCGWLGAAAGAVFLVVLRAGFYFLYRRSLPYVPPRLNRGATARANGDKIEDWFKPPATRVEFLNFAGLGDLEEALSDKSLESFVSITARDLRDAGVDSYPSRYAARLRQAYQELPRGPTCFRDMLASGMVPTAAQLGTCRRQETARRSDALSVAGHMERRAFEEVTGVIARRYRKPRWHHRPWRHRLHFTLRQRFERYSTEFAAERDAYEHLELLSKEDERADLIRQRNAANASNRRFPRSDASRLVELERDLVDLRQTAEDKELAQRGMVLRVPACVEIKQ